MSRQHLWCMLVLLAATAWPLGAALGATPAIPLSQRLRQAAEMAESRARQTEALALCKRVLDEASSDAADKVAALQIIIDVYRRQSKFDEAIKTADRLREMFPSDKAVEQQAFLLQADLYSQWKKDDQALAMYQELLRRQPESKAGAAGICLKIAALHLKEKRYAECCNEAAKAMTLAPEDGRRMAETLFLTVEALWRAEDMEKCAASFPKLLEAKVLAARDPNEQRDLRFRYAQCLRRLKRYDDAAAHCAACEKAETDPRVGADWCMQAGDIRAEQERYDDALAAYERVFTAHPEVTDAWWNAQRRIAELLAKKGAAEEALKAARVCMDACTDEKALADIVRMMADMLRSQDKNLGRANALISYQRFGPAGEGGKAGDAGELKDPLAGVGYPSYPAREQVFAEARKQAGADARAMRYRAMTYLYTGHPKEALRCFMDAFGRASSDEMSAAGHDMIVIGARAVRGHSVGLDAFYNFVNYGPAGPDGKPGTADDLADPFAALLK